MVCLFEQNTITKQVLYLNLSDYGKVDVRSRLFMGVSNNVLLIPMGNILVVQLV